MSGYVQINLQNLINEYSKNGQSGEDKAKEILSTFSCPLNADVEYYLHNKAIEFSKQSIAITHLVFASYKSTYVLAGYYALSAHKTFVLSKNALTSKLKKRIGKFGTYDNQLKQLNISAPLIGQLGKNFTNGYNKLISGDELLQLAYEKISMFQREIGGKIVYLECEDKPKLVDFYTSNGFVTFGKRDLDKDEVGIMDGDYLIQLLRYRED